MHPLLLISPGMTAALGVALVLRFVWAGVARNRNEDWREASARNELLYVSAHAALGAMIGLLFWLSWGFAALVQMSWWQRGLAFGLLNAALIALPLLILHSLLRLPRLLGKMLLIECLCTCIAAGLACSWAWSKSL